MAKKISAEARQSPAANAVTPLATTMEPSSWTDRSDRTSQAASTSAVRSPRQYVAGSVWRVAKRSK